jgi:hypothetical protein
LVQAKKTQRDKDWPMIRRLVEAHYFQNRDSASTPQVRFWLRELRTPELLVQVAQANASSCRGLLATRPLLVHAASGNAVALQHALNDEEAAEREHDKTYWLPLRRELEELRHP